MNIQFRKIHLPQLLEVDADALIELAGNKQDGALHPPALPRDVTKSKTISRYNLDEIIQDIVNSNTHNITILEWIYCLYNKEKWDNLNPERSRITSEAIWKAADQNAWLKQRLFWNLLLNYDGKKALALSLIESFYVFSFLNLRDKQILSIFEAFDADFPEIQLAQLCLNLLLTPRELFLQHQLPTKINIIEKCFLQVPSLFSHISHKSNERVNWLLRCFEQMESTQGSIPLFN